VIEHAAVNSRARLFDAAPLILRHERAFAPPQRAALIDFFSLPHR
jgi:hypothetical protein